MTKAKAKARIWDLVINGFAASVFFPPAQRGKLYGWTGISVGNGARVRSGVWVDSKRLSLGPDSFINHDCRISNLSAHVTIGARVAVASRVMITTEAHDSSDPNRRSGPISPSPVMIGDGTWIGAGALILPGVSIGAGCIIAAGAVVATDCEPHGLYAGVPAIRKKDLAELSDSTSPQTPHDPMIRLRTQGNALASISETGGDHFRSGVG